MINSNINGGKALRIVVGFLMLTLYFAWVASAATLIVNATGGAMYTKIQDAINNASAGDTILVDSGTYYENVDVNKQLILKGNNTGGGNPVVDPGDRSGNAIILRAGFITLEGFIVVNSNWGGIRAISNNNIIRNNTASNCVLGIHLFRSSSNIIDNNTINQNQYGISFESSYLGSSNKNTLTRNIMTGNSLNLLFGDFGYYVSDFDNNIDTSNLVDGRPIYYIKNIDNVVYDSSIDAGLFYCISCINVVFRDMILNNGIFFINTTNSRIQNATYSNNAYTGTEPQRYSGISLFKSDNNILIGNNVSNNGFGISLFESKSNTLSGNNASNNSYGIILRLWSHDSILIDNNASNNENGIFIVESYKNTLNGNTASSNSGNGLTLSSTHYNVLNGNNVSNNHIGISLIYSSYDNTIYNNFFNNPNNFDMMYGNMINSWNLTKTAGVNIIGGPYLGGNFWAHPNGTGFSQTCQDNNKDGLCDVQYTLADNNIDYLPLTMMTQNFPPVADCGANKLKCENVVSPVSFNASASYDPDGTIVSYYWDFGDGTNATGVMPVHKYSTYRWNGTSYQPFTVNLTVTDNDGMTNTTSIKVVIWIPGDANGDGKVNILDASVVGLKWGTAEPCADLNNDGKVNILDASIIGLNWGKIPIIQ